MHWYLHLTVHYLDLFRHEIISTIAWEAVKTNIGATWPWQAGIVAIFSYFFVPRFRNWVNNHFKSVHDKLDGNHKAIIDQAQQHHDEKMKQAQDHHESLKQHITDILNKKD